MPGWGITREGQPLREDGGVENGERDSVKERLGGGAVFGMLINF